ESVYKLRELQARFETAGNLNIDFDGRPTKLNIDVKGSSLAYAGEFFDGFAAEVKMNAGRLNVREIKLKRESVEGRGSVLWDMDTNYLEYDFSMLGLSLKSFNLYRLLPLSLESLFDLDIYGSGILSADHSMRSSIITRESMIRKNKVPNSRLDAYFANNELTVQADLMESMAR